MTDMRVVAFDNIYVRVECEAGIAQELSQFFTFEVPGARFTPAYRSKKWDGKIRIFNYVKRMIYRGLVDHIRIFADREGYTFENTIVADGVSTTKDTVQQFIDILEYHVQSKPIKLRDYQVDAIYQCITNDRKLILSPTSSGKSSIIGGLIRWYVNQGLRCLVLVPTTSLVSQMYGDFEDYFGNTWNVDENCYKIMGGIEKNNSRPCVISTWQSMHSVSKNNKEYLSQFDVVICDEAHLAKAKAITGIMELCINAKYRFGFTGTLDGTQTNKLVLTGLFGSVYQTITTKELIDNKQISDLKIKCISLQYTEDERKQVKEMDYQNEIDFIVSHEKRNRFIANLALKQPGNTLVLFNLVERHGKPLYERILNKAEGRRVFFVFGGVDAEEREEIRSITETESNAIIVASYGVFSTGISIRNIHNVVFASPSKSRIRNLQSIGRGLRQHESKDHCTLFDIIDDLGYKKYRNYTLKHAVERIKIYSEEDFDYKIIKIAM